MVTVEFRHTNNGGHWWLSEDDWADLADAGWTVSRDTNTAKIHAGDVEAAIAHWAETLPHFNPEDRGCECCSEPFIFTVINEWDDEPWSSDYDELSYQSYSLGWGDF